jgi:hypothetical protein
MMITRGVATAMAEAATVAVATEAPVGAGRQTRRKGRKANAVIPLGVTL